MTQESATAEVKMWMVVTATVTTNMGTEAGTCLVSDDYPIENAIDMARNEAIERYRDSIDSDGLPAAHRIDVHVDTFPEPKPRGALIFSTLPEQTEDEPISSQVM